MEKSSSRILISICLGMLCLCSFAVASAQETMSMVTFYPSPDGVYKILRLIPRTDINPVTATCNEQGRLFYNNTDNTIYSCDGTKWSTLGDTLWSLDQTYLHAGDPVRPNDTLSIGVQDSPCSYTGKTYIEGNQMQLKNPSGNATFTIQGTYATFHMAQEIVPIWRFDTRPANSYGGPLVIESQAPTYGYPGIAMMPNFVGWHVYTPWIYTWQPLLAVMGRFRAKNLLNLYQHANCPNDVCETTVTFPAGQFSTTPVVICTAGPCVDSDPAHLPKGNAAVSCSIKNKTATSVSVVLGTHDSNRPMGGWMTVHLMAMEP